MRKPKVSVMVTDCVKYLEVNRAQTCTKAAVLRFSWNVCFEGKMEEQKSVTKHLRESITVRRHYGRSEPR